MIFFKSICLFCLIFTISLIKCRPQEDSNQNNCNVIEEGSGLTKKCQFPFIYKEQMFDGCTTLDGSQGKPWCSTNTDPKTKEHIVGGQHYGDCLLDTCPMQSILDLEANDEEKFQKWIDRNTLSK